MSNYMPSKSFFDAASIVGADPTLHRANETAAQRGADERLIDLALRNVPLPEGLLTRLGKFVYALPEEPADHVDWLGC